MKQRTLVSLTWDDTGFLRFTALQQGLASSHIKFTLDVVGIITVTAQTLCLDERLHPKSEIPRGSFLVRRSGQIEGTARNKHDEDITTKEARIFCEKLTRFSMAVKSSRCKFSINAYQEGDNKNSPIDFTISDESEQILNEAGDNQLLASQPGIIELEGDSLGLYSAIDSVISGEIYKIYLYSQLLESILVLL